jgi:hypothetical protein
VLVARLQQLRVRFLCTFYSRNERIEEPTAVNNGGNQYALLLYAIDDAVAVHKSLADRSVVNLWNNASQLRMVGNGFGRFDNL